MRWAAGFSGLSLPVGEHAQNGSRCRHSSGDTDEDVGSAFFLPSILEQGLGELCGVGEPPLLMPGELAVRAAAS